MLAPQASTFAADMPIIAVSKQSFFPEISKIGSTVAVFRLVALKGANNLPHCGYGSDHLSR
jgi:hypothetical protein